MTSPCRSFWAQERRPLVLPLGLLAVVVACVPAGNAQPYDAGVVVTAPATVAPKRVAPTSPPLTSVFEDTFDRAPSAFDAAAAVAVAAPSAAASSVASPVDAGRDGGRPPPTPSSLPSSVASGPAPTPPGAPRERSGLGPDWLVAQGGGNAWRIEQGRLCGRGAKNKGVWLNRTLPTNARIEFDAISDSPEGDLKAEVWGDGQSGATSVSYTNATSYLVIYGGWKNTFHVLARINEHGTDRKEIGVKPSTDEFRERAVSQGQVYRFKIERSDGKTVRWWVNDVDMLSYEDPEPLVGATHDHFGFNNWQVRVCFDNVKVTPL